MGVKFWFIVYSDGDAREHLKSLPAPDEAASRALAEELFQREAVSAEMQDFGMSDPRGKEVLVGVYPGVTIVAAEAFGIDYPSQLDERFIARGNKGRMTLHAQHSVVDWTAFAWWENGVLRRSLSVSPDNGVQEDIGDRLAFEEGFWNPAEEIYDPDVLPYGHPLELGEEALLHFLGCQYEGHADNMLWDPFDLSILAIKLGKRMGKPRWKPW